MAGLLLSFQNRKLLVTGSTYDVRELLKSAGGRWDAELKGWTFPSDSKQRLLDLLHSSKDVRNVEDAALVRLTLEKCDKGHLVRGETYPVRDLLKDKGGRWDSTLLGWVFPAALGAAKLSASLKASQHVSHVDRASKASAAQQLALCETPDRAERAAGDGRGSTGKKKAERGEPPCTLARTGSGVRVVDVGKKQRSVKTGSDGSRTEVQTEKRERRISGKRPGVPSETQSVTKKREVTETKDKIVETSTITVRRVRKK